jgi:SAM-dependent methyltransferase
MPGNDPPLPLYEAPDTRERFDSGARRIQRQFWDNQAAEWDDGRAGRGLQPNHLERMVPWLADPVLLVGAGRGTMLRALRAKGHDATGVDWSARMVEEARREGMVGLSHGDACHLPRDSRTLATVIFSTGVLLPTHTRDRTDAYLGEARRVLVPGGHLILCLWFQPGSGAAQRAAENVKLPIHTLRAQVHWDLAPLAAILSDYGFDTVGQVKLDDIMIWSLAKSN